MYATDLSGSFTYVSPAVEDLSSYLPAEMLGRSFLDFLHPQDRPTMADTFQRNLRGEDVAGEFRVVDKAGGIRWLRSFGRPRIVAGRLIGLTGSFSDITARKDAEQAAAESEARYHQFVEMSPHAVVIHSDGKVVFVNSAAVALMGADGPADLVGRFVLDSVRPDMREEVASRIARIQEPDVAGTVRAQTLVRLDGTTVDVEAIGMPMSYQGRLAVQVMLQDITERERAQEALRNSEERYRSLVENITDVVYTLDGCGNITYISPAIERISSYTPAEVMGAEFSRFLHPDDRSRLAETFLLNLQGGPAETEFRVLDKAGDVRWIHASTRKHFVEGDLVGVTGVFREITDRKRAQAALEQSDNRYRELVENAHEIIYSHDLAGNFLSVNPALEVVTGYTTEEMLTMTIDQVLSPDTLDQVRHLLTNKPGELERRATRELTIVAKDGREVVLEISPRGSYQDGVLVGVQGIARDITQRKKDQEEIRLLNDRLESRVLERTAQLQAAYEELDAFCSTVSHDLRAPLRVIEGFSHVFLEEYGGSLHQEGRYYIERVHATSTRMDMLIQDLLAMARVSRIAMERETVDVGEIARSVGADLSRLHPGRVIDFVVADRMQDSADPGLLRIVLANLLGNSWKYTGNHATARIEMGMACHGSEPAYFVRDDGAGFDMAHAGRLFGEFQRLHSVGEFEGTGVGLATVRRIVERHGGSVWAEGAVEGGATFWFTLGGSASADAAPANSVVEYRRRPRPV